MLERSFLAFLQDLPLGYSLVCVIHQAASRRVVRAVRNSDGLLVVLIIWVSGRSSTNIQQLFERELTVMRQLQPTGVCLEVLEYRLEEAILVLRDDGGA